MTGFHSGLMQRVWQLSLLVIPYFGGASYVYKNFIRPYISENSQIQKWNILFLHRREGFRVTEQSTFLDVTERNDIKLNWKKRRNMSYVR
jgi:hypothetical protein